MISQRNKGMMGQRNKGARAYPVHGGGYSPGKTDMAPRCLERESIETSTRAPCGAGIRASRHASTTYRCWVWCVRTTNPRAPIALDASVNIAGSALACTTSPQQHHPITNKNPNMHTRPCPRPSSTGGHYSADMPRQTSRAFRNGGPEGTELHPALWEAGGGGKGGSWRGRRKHLRRSCP